MSYPLIYNTKEERKQRKRDCELAKSALQVTSPRRNTSALRNVFVKSLCEPRLHVEREGFGEGVDTGHVAGSGVAVGGICEGRAVFDDFSSAEDVRAGAFEG